MPEITDLLAALPEEVAEESAPRDALHQMLARLSHKAVPTGQLLRLWTLGGMKAKIALAYLAYWIRSSYATRDEKEKLLNETHLKAALQLLSGMGYLRGAAAKIGQMLAQCPNVVPTEFAEALSKLHFEAPAMHYSLLREHLRNELGGEPEEIFAEFDRRAFAAASLGQVHRARLKSGEFVAVKVQYPNIAGTIESDFRNLMALLMPMRLSKDWDNIRAQLDDVRQMLTWETDYEREAGFQQKSRTFFREDEGVVVPKVYEAHSTKRVLVMDYLDGMHLEQYLTTNPVQSERDRYGGLIMRASFRIAHAARLWYADPNPGNYLFLRDGRLGMIDFGCCREFSDQEWDFYKDVGNSYLAGGDALRKAMYRAADLNPNEPQDEAYIQFLVEYASWFSYYMDSEPFDFANEEYIQRGIDMIMEVGRKRYFRSIPVNTWIFRQLLGLKTLCYRLKARIDMKTMTQEESVGIFIEK